MSTILDALRKLQRERSAANPSRDLRGSVTDEMPLPPARRSGSRRGLAAGVLSAGLVGVLALGAAWLYRKGFFERAPQLAAAQPPVAAPPRPEAPARVATTPLEGDPSPQDRGATEEELEAAEREMDAATAADAPSEGGAPSVAAPPVDEAALERARLEEARRAAAAAEQARRESEARAAAAPPPAPAPATTPAPAPALATPPRPAATTAARAKPAPSAAAPAAKARTRSKPKPVEPPAETARRAPAPEPDDALGAAVSFPDVRVESIRWHPLAERREASLRLDQQDARDAHEGDIIGGVLVYRIEPGAVELRVGSTSRVVRPTP